jgi:hypothetical protein
VDQISAEKDSRLGERAAEFFKHGHRYPKRQLHYVPEHSEQLMYDAALCSEHVTGRMRPVIETFMLRFVISHPEHLKDSTDLENSSIPKVLSFASSHRLVVPSFLRKSSRVFPLGKQVPHIDWEEVAAPLGVRGSRGVVSTLARPFDYVLAQLGRTPQWHA